MIEENLSLIGEKVKIISPKNEFALGHETHNSVITLGLSSIIQCLASVRRQFIFSNEISSEIAGPSPFKLISEGKVKSMHSILSLMEGFESNIPLSAQNNKSCSQLI